MMGSLWLPDLADWLRDAGLDVDEYPGWLTRSRSSGGYDDILGIGIHHDASNAHGTLASSCRYGWETAEFRPVGALRLDRGPSGKVVVGAAGATNTQGKGGPLRCSRGTIPLDSGNRYVIAWEPLNNGVGEVWSPEQRAAYTLGCAGIIVGLRDQGAYDAARGTYRKITLDPLAMDVHAHFEWTTRKIDPAGPPDPFADMSDRYMRWQMDKFRRAVADDVARLSGGVNPPPGGDTVIDVDVMHLPTRGERVYDSRANQPVYHNPGVAKGPLKAGETRKIATAMAHAAQVRLTVVSPTTHGFVIADGTPGGTIPLDSYAPGDTPHGNVRWVALPDGHLYVSSPQGGVDVIVDVFGTG